MPSKRKNGRTHKKFSGINVVLLAAALAAALFLFTAEKRNR